MPRTNTEGKTQSPSQPTVIYLHNVAITTAMCNTLPKKMYSLHEYTAHAKSLNKNPWEYTRFALTGEVAGVHQANVNASLNDLKPHESISSIRDYPCILGITRDIVVDCPLILYPISDPGDAITTSTHLDYPVRVQPESFWFLSRSTEVTAYRARGKLPAFLPHTIKYPTLGLGFGGMPRNPTIQVLAPSTFFFLAWV